MHNAWWELAKAPVACAPSILPSDGVNISFLPSKYDVVHTYSLWLVHAVVVVVHSLKSSTSVGIRPF